MFSFAAATAEWLRRADHHRIVVLALVLLKVVVEALIGIETHPAVVVLLLAWLLVAHVVARRTREQPDGTRAHRVRTSMLVADIVGASTATYLVGGTAWFGPLVYGFLLLIGAVALSGRALAAFTTLAIVAYGVPLYAEAYGLLPPQRLAGTALPAGTFAQATAAWLFGALLLGSLSALLHAFVGLVRRGAEWHELLVREAPVMISTIDRTGHVTAANPAAAEAFQLPLETLVGRHFHVFLAPDTAAEADRRFGRVLAGEPQHFETRMRRADGEERWADVMAHPIGATGRVADGVLCLVRDVTEARAAAEALTRQAYHDALTGLANRVRFAERLDAAHARAVGAGDASAVAVLVLDLDGFKTVNDSLGHAAGDRLLVEMAGRLLAATRGSDMVARLGGDEFAVLLENVRADADAIAVADRIIASLHAPFVVGGRQAFVGTSVGIARGDSAGGDDVHDLPRALAVGIPESHVAAAVLRNADAAMYQAKAAGKGRWAVFHPEMHAAALSRLALAGELRQALEREELTLVYQPVMDLASGRVRGVEALVRWRHPSRGLVMPNEFIPFAEETGLVVPLGAWVLQRACAQVAAWRMTIAPDLTVAVNVSGQQLDREEIVAEVAAALAESGLPGAALTLEITEHTVVARPDVVRARLLALRALGVQVAIDDFGTGYSALAQLQHFPLDVLKIDRAFVARMDRAGAPAAVVRALVTIGEALSLRVIAEGVETAEQQMHLAQLGCDGAQGYLYARPLTPAEAAAWLGGHRAANERRPEPTAGHAA